MAGDWIKMRGNLWDDPRVARLCDLTDSPEAMIVGGLYWLWATADQHSEDGVMPGLTLRSIDRKTGIQGFGQALCDIGWLADHPEGVRIIRFEEHNGASAKRRGLDAQRKANLRNVSASHADMTPTDDGQNAPDGGARDRVREEKEGKALSGKPDAESDPDSPAGLLAYLNAKAGKAFRPVDSNLGRIAARLKTCSPDDVRAVIDTQVEKWGRDEKMTEYLRPETLFGALKFEGYLGNLPAASAHAAPDGEPDPEAWRSDPAFAGVH